MELFIINKKEFKKVFDCLDSTDLSSNAILLEAYSELLESLEKTRSIPLGLSPHYDEDGIVIFDFLFKKGDIYFYKYSGTAK
jgi:hypothetical protein